MCEQVPTGAEEPNAADLALYDTLAKALLGEGISESSAAGGDAGCMQRLLHYCLGTQLRKYLDRSAHPLALVAGPRISLQNNRFTEDAHWSSASPN